MINADNVLKKEEKDVRDYGEVDKSLQVHFYLSLGVNLILT
jgi:hypothetical protein